MVNAAYPTAVLVDPNGQLIFDDIGHAVHQSRQILWMVLAHAVDG